MKLPCRKKPCLDCPFRKDILQGWLGETRMQEILSTPSFVCHKRTDLQCAGHMILKGESNKFVALAKQMGINLELTGRELVFDDPQGCIAHHAYSRNFAQQPAYGVNKL